MLVIKARWCRSVPCPVVCAAGAGCHLPLEDTTHRNECRYGCSSSGGGRGRARCSPAARRCRSLRCQCRLGERTLLVDGTRAETLPGPACPLGCDAAVADTQDGGCLRFTPTHLADVVVVCELKQRADAVRGAGRLCRTPCSCSSWSPLHHCWSTPRLCVLGAAFAERVAGLYTRLCSSKCVHAGFECICVQAGGHIVGVCSSSTRAASDCAGGIGFKQ